MKRKLDPQRLPAGLQAEADGTNAETDRLNRFVSTKWAAEYLDVSEDSIRREVARGNLPCYRVGERNVRYRLKDVEALAQSVAS